MCYSYLKKNRNWALWLSGFFGATAISNLFLALINQPITFMGIVLDRNLYLLRFAIQSVLAYVFIHYWGKAQRKGRMK